MSGSGACGANTALKWPPCATWWPDNVPPRMTGALYRLEAFDIVFRLEATKVRVC